VANSVELLLRELIQNKCLFKYEDQILTDWYKAIRGDGLACVSEQYTSLYGGFFANSVGQAFVNGYEVAIQRLTGIDTRESIAAFCVTENKSTHPTSMLSCLTVDKKGNYTLSGKKDFVTLAGDAKKLFVAVNFGVSAAGQKIIKLVEVNVASSGVSIQLLPELPFVPDVTHGVVNFDSVVIEASNILSGDGYSDYVKPFRWFEDINVFMSVSAYLFKLTLAFDWPEDAKVEMISLLTSLSGLHKMKADDPVAHIVMFNQTEALDKWLERYDEAWNAVTEDVVLCWKRDIALLKIATRARKARYKNAVSALSLL
jgi:acyl-CoA dehydrogenase